MIKKKVEVVSQLSELGSVIFMMPTHLACICLCVCASVCPIVGAQFWRMKLGFRLETVIFEGKFGSKVLEGEVRAWFGTMTLEVNVGALLGTMI